jgi:hypothetical protein
MLGAEAPLARSGSHTSLRFVNGELVSPNDSLWSVARMRAEMLQAQLAAAIAAARSTAAIDMLAKALWSSHASGLVTDDEASALSEAIEGRRAGMWKPRDAGAISSGPRTKFPDRVSSQFATKSQTLFARARMQRPPERAAAIARRRQLAASGPMPPALAAHFTTGELAALRIVADEVREKGMCDRTYGEIAARAGVCRRTAQNGIRRAGRLGLVNIEERPRPGRKHLANVVRIISPEWRAWIDRRPARSERIGGKTLVTTDSRIQEGSRNREREGQARAPGRLEQAASWRVAGSAGFSARR